MPPPIIRPIRGTVAGPRVVASRAPATHHLRAGPVVVEASTSSCSSSTSSTRPPSAFSGHNRQLVEKLRLAGRGSRGSRPLSSAVSAVAAPEQAATASIMKTVEVALGDRSYPIYIGNGLLKDRGDLLRKHIPGKRVLVVTNEKVAPLYLDQLSRCMTLACMRIGRARERLTGDRAAAPPPIPTPSPSPNLPRPTPGASRR
jgi:3-dehydroquinate synthase